MPVDVRGAIVGWLVQFQLVGQSIIAAGSGRRKLQAAVDAAVQTVLAEVADAAARESLGATLREHFIKPPQLLNGGTPASGGR